MLAKHGGGGRETRGERGGRVPKTRSGEKKLEEIKETRDYKDAVGSLTVNEALDALFKRKGKAFKKKFQSKYQYYVENSSLNSS